MAESRNKIKAIGAPFEVQFSSCSDIKPSEFDWSHTEGDIEVLIDAALMYKPESLIPKIQRFGWLCESSAIQHPAFQILKNNHEYLFSEFYNKIFTCDKRLLDLNFNFQYIPAGSNYPWVRKSDWGIYTDKSKLCSITASPKTWSDGHKYRHLVAKLAKDKGYSLFGGAHGSPRDAKSLHVFGSLTRPWNTKIHHLKEYMFHIVVENDKNDFYYTEKLTDCFATGTIPIYWGTESLPSIFSESGIIRLQQGKELETLNELTLEKYYSMLDGVKHNFKALDSLKIADDYLYEIIKNETSNIKCGLLNQS